MSRVKEVSRSYQVYLTEQTLKELVYACEKAKEEPPMKARGLPAVIQVESQHCDVSFEVRLDRDGNMESLGYRQTGQLYDYDMHNQAGSAISDH